MGRPIIGITGELEAARWGNWIREAVVSPVSYTRAVERAGGTPVILPPVPASSVPVLIAGLSGLVLTGGRDVDPSLYDEAPHEQTDLPDHRRDRFELILTRAAIEADLPFLAIGRGMHILNVARGGTLTQHLPDRIGNESHKPDPVKMTIHDVQISRDEQARARAWRDRSGARGPPPGDQPDRQRAPHRGVDHGSGRRGDRAAGTPMGSWRAVESRGRRRPPAVRGPGDGGQVRLRAGRCPASARNDRAIQAIRQAPRRPLLLAPLYRPLLFAASSTWTVTPVRRGFFDGHAELRQRCSWGRRGGGCQSSRARGGLGDLCGGPAAVLGGIGPAIPQRLRSLYKVGVVAVGVAPAAFGRVGRDSVQFDT